MTHVPGGAPGPADEQNSAQSDPWAHPTDPAQPAGQPGIGQPPGAGQPPGGYQQPGAGAGQPDPQHAGHWQAGPEQPAGATGATSIGLDPRIAGLLAYAFGWLSGLVILLTEKQHQPVRFHAAQSIALFGSLSVLGALTSAVSFIPVIGWILALAWLLIGPLAVFLWIFMMIRAYNQVQTRLPLAADLADKILGAVR